MRMRNIALKLQKSAFPHLQLRLRIFRTSLKTAVEPLPVLHLLESTRTCSCLGFHQFGALRSSCSCTHNNALDGPKMASTAVFKIKGRNSGKDQGQGSRPRIKGKDQGQESSCKER